ncbi:type II toxin-antitoxin system RnlB family antitoxin [Massilia oculi]|uniref:type II toxin-antitoxin system RnlB family antitoxin n=1 Tax=Massilia oculi TaxID=945844 RepID=UPI001AAE558F|nr:type II toxin-antitoxin system RnlB family antitoxin [Massilia oculi]
MRDDKHYEVHNVAKEGALVCLSLDRVRPDSYMEDLEEELRKGSYRGEVVLDLFAANGNTSHRFMRLLFDGMKLHWLRAKIAKPESIPAGLLGFCNDFYFNHPEIVEKSVLSREAQLKFLGEHAFA